MFKFIRHKNTCTGSTNMMWSDSEALGRQGNWQLCQLAQNSLTLAPGHWAILTSIGLQWITEKTKRARKRSVCVGERIKPAHSHDGTLHNHSKHGAKALIYHSNRADVTPRTLLYCATLLYTLLRLSSFALHSLLFFSQHSHLQTGELTVFTTFINIRINVNEQRCKLSHLPLSLMDLCIARISVASWIQLEM